MQLAETNTKIEAFLAAIFRGMEALEEAGVIYVELLDADPAIKDRIREEHPEINNDMLATFERIGRKQLYYKLSLLESPGTRALARCPYSEQLKYSTEPVPMLLLNDGSPDELAVSVNTMSKPQVKQVFGATRVRTLAEQRTWLQASKPRPKTITTSKPYTIHHGKITFHEAVTLTTADLARLLAEIA